MRVQHLFASRHAWLAAILLAVLVALPSLGSGLFLDDYQQRMALFSGDQNGDANVFEFFHRGTPVTEAQLQSGVLAWWTHPDTKVMFYRPVAQWLMELDYRLWPNSLLMMHLQSVLWYGLAALVAGLAYRQIMPTPWSAGLAAVLFAVDSAHGPAVAWLANRNAFIAFSAAVLALLCYRQTRARWQIAGCALYAFSLLCSEGALAITGYLFAHSLCLSSTPWTRRLLRLLPYALISVAWIAFWKAHGYGTAGPGWYVDPGSNPLLFLRSVVIRTPFYLEGQFFFPPADVFGLTESTSLLRYTLPYSLVVVALLVWILAPLLRRSPLARFYGVGLLIAVIPICGSVPVNRSLWFVGFGAIGLLVLFVEQFRGLSMSPARLRVSAALATSMLVLHLWISPVLFVLMGKIADVMDGAMDAQHVQLPVDGTVGRKLLILSTPSYMSSITFPLIKDQALSLGPAPKRSAPAVDRVVALVETRSDFDLQRPDVDTLLVTSAAGLDALRPQAYGFSAGDRVVLSDVTITVRSVSPNRAPTEVEYRFRPGVLPDYRVLAWQGEHFEPATLPEVGAHRTIQTRG